MALIEAFCGLRYNGCKISDLASVTAPPNDRISDEFYNQLCSKNEYNIARAGFCERAGESMNDDELEKSSSLLNSWIDDEILLRDSEPSLYIYEQKFTMKSNPQAFKGIIALVRLEEYDKRVILPHQKTSENGRLHQYRLLSSSKANISPIFSLYNDSDISIASIIAANSLRTPDVNFVTEDNITENLWVISDDAVISLLKEHFKDKQLFIADGHHRYETYLNYRNEMRQKYPDLKDAPYEYAMMALMPMYSSGLFVFPTHRLVRGIESFDENILITMLTEDFKVSRIYFTSNDYDQVIINKISDVISEKYFGLYTGKDYYYLLKPHKAPKNMQGSGGSGSDILSGLEATLLNTSILEKYLGISKEELENPQIITYTRSAREAIHQVQLGNYQCAFFLNSTRVDEMRRVAEAGEVMPLKSTFFWPKILTGLVIYKFDR